MREGMWGSEYSVHPSGTGSLNVGTQLILKAHLASQGDKGVWPDRKVTINMTSPDELFFLREAKESSEDPCSFYHILRSETQNWFSSTALLQVIPVTSPLSLQDE